MQYAGGILLAPVQKLVITNISAGKAEMQTNLDTRTKEWETAFAASHSFLQRGSNKLNAADRWTAARNGLTTISLYLLHRFRFREVPPAVF